MAASPEVEVPIGTLQNIRAEVDDVTEEHHLEFFKCKLGSCGDVTERNKLIRPFLQRVCANNHVNNLKYVLRIGGVVYINEKFNFEGGDQTLLAKACSNGFHSVVKVLLAAGADPFCVQRDGSTLLCLASVYGHVEVVKALLEQRSTFEASVGDNLKDAGENSSTTKPTHFDNINAQRKCGNTAINFASVKGHFEIVKLLIKHGANVNLVNKKGYSPLMSAAVYGHETIAEMLMMNGADVEVNCNDECTALLFAASRGYLRIVQLLIQHNAYVLCNDKYGQTPLLLAADNGHADIVEFLLKHGAKADSETKDGVPAMYFACLNGHVDVVMLLVSHGVSVNSWVGNTMTPIMVAKKRTMTKLLLDLGANINAESRPYKESALTLATRAGILEVVETLLESKWRVNLEHRSENGLTPLMEAASQGFVKVGEALLDKGANINAPNPKTGNALLVAIIQGRVQFVKMLLDRGAKVNEKTSWGSTVLHVACERGELKIVKALVSKEADVEARDKRKMTCLETAFQKGHHNVVEWLVKLAKDLPNEREMQRYILKNDTLKENCVICETHINTEREKRQVEWVKKTNAWLKDMSPKKTEKNFQSKMEKKSMKTTGENKKVPIKCEGERALEPPMPEAKQTPENKTQPSEMAKSQNKDLDIDQDDKNANWKTVEGKSKKQAGRDYKVFVPSKPQTNYEEMHEVRGILNKLELEEECKQKLSNQMLTLKLSQPRGESKVMAIESKSGIAPFCQASSLNEIDNKGELRTPNNPVQGTSVMLAPIQERMYVSGNLNEATNAEFGDEVGCYAKGEDGDTLHHNDETSSESWSPWKPGTKYEEAFAETPVVVYNQRTGKYELLYVPAFVANAMQM